MVDSKKRRPPDQAQRDLILEDLDRTLLVEAAAGTGKTTSMVGRMVALLASGKCARVDQLAAVTFTRKSAAELRARFQAGLERAVSEPGCKAVARDRLTRALARVEQCFIGTIHSFCGRLLRERPVEAGVDVAFREADDLEDRRIRTDAWDAYVADCYVRGASILDELSRLGLEIGQLRAAFLRFAEYPDVDIWPAPKVALPDLNAAKQALDEYVQHMGRLIPTFPDDPGNDKLMPRYRLIYRAWKHGELSQPAELMEVLGQFKKTIPVQKMWPQGPDQAKEERDRFDDFRNEFVEPCLEAWLAHRYEPVLRALLPAVEVYDRKRAALGILNYQDLLMKAATLLKSDPSVRAYFGERFTHLLVDEFQDTDPVQAEVMLLLTADRQEERDWRKCRPRPGSLFVVGDPKQSIYRFRRADIVTYNEVKRIIRESGGEVVLLSCNFRTEKPVVEWVNQSFESRFPDEATSESPVYVPLQVGRLPEAGAGPVDGPPPGSVKVLEVHAKSVGEAVDEEADIIARTIRRAVDEQGRRPEEFLIVSWKRKRLSHYARALRIYGLPHQVSGGSALDQVEELALLHRCLKAVIEPDNAVALVGALRCSLFGISDQALYAFKKAGGIFCYRDRLPKDVKGGDRKALTQAFERMSLYAGWFARLPCVAVMEKVADDLGLPARAMTTEGGDVQAGSLAKAMELLRAAQKEMWTLADMVDYPGRLVNAEESYDGISARPQLGPGVRVMNLHKVKGLEAPVVFLVDPSQPVKSDAEIHIDRAGKEVRGFVPILPAKRGNYQSPPLAQPPDWSLLAAKEKKFLEAEKKRLFYVAATRAGRDLTVVRWMGTRRKYTWKFFETFLDGCSVLEDPGDVCPPEWEEEVLDPREVARAESDRARRWSKLSETTYEMRKAKELEEVPSYSRRSSGEHGMEWGTVIHALLQAAMNDAGQPLDNLACSVLTANSMDLDRKDEALRQVGKVMKSDYWKRALKSPEFYVEVPIQIGEDREGEKSTVMRGVIDLVFREKEVWTIVDYKTDDLDDKALAEKYKTQLENYKRAWEKATSQKVIETKALRV